MGYVKPLLLVGSLGLGTLSTLTGCKFGQTIDQPLNTTSLRLVSGVPSVRISVLGIQYLTSMANTLLPSVGLSVSILLIVIGKVE